MISSGRASGDQQEKANVFCVYRQCIGELQEGEHSGKKSLIRWSIEKICSVQSSQLLLEVLAIGFTLK